MRPHTKRAVYWIGRLIRDRWILITSWLIPTLFIYYSFAGSAAYQACVSGPLEQKANHTRAEETATIPYIVSELIWTRWECSGAFVEANHEDIIALFTVILAVVTGTLWRATERLVKGAETTAEKQLRAYITIDKTSVMSLHNGEIVEGGDRLVANYEPSSEIRMINSGQTPAYDVRIRGNNAFLEWPIDPDKMRIDPADDDSSKAIIGPGGNKSLWHALGENLGADEIAALKAGTHAFVAYGVITYKTIFGRDSFLNYRYFIGGPVGLAGASMSPHSEGNEADYSS